MTMLTEPGSLAVADGDAAARSRRRWRTQAAADANVAAADPDAGFTRQFAAEWIALLFALAVVGALIGWSLFKAHEAVDATERDRLRVQARVVDDNVGQQLDGMYRALASVRGEFLATPVYSVSTLLSMRLKSLSDAIPGVRSMVSPRCRRHRRRQQRRRAARPRLLGSQVLQEGARRPQRRDALRRAAAARR